MSKVSIISCFYNRPLQMVERTLWSLKEQNKDYEFIMVDDGSLPEFNPKHLIEKYGFKYIRMEKPSGVTFRSLSYPMNEGIRQSTGDILILSGSDLFHTEGTIDKLVEAHSEIDELYLCSSVYSYGHYTRIKLDSGQMDYKSLFTEQGFNNLVKDEWKNQNNPGLGLWYIHPEYNPNYYCFLTSIKRKHLYNINGMNEDFIENGFEDLDFIQRLRGAFPQMYFKIDTNIKSIHQFHDGVVGIKGSKEIVISNNWSKIRDTVNRLCHYGRSGGWATNGLIKG